MSSDDSNSSSDRTSEHDQQDTSAHGQASERNGGHSGEGAASAMAHMIRQDQKHRRQSGESGEEDTRG